MYLEKTIIKTGSKFAVVENYNLKNYMAEVYGHIPLKVLADYEREKPVKRRNKHILLIETVVTGRLPRVEKPTVSDYVEKTYINSEKYDRQLAETISEMFDDQVLKEVLLR